MGSSRKSSSASEATRSKRSRKVPTYLQSSVLIPAVAGILVLGVILGVALTRKEKSSEAPLDKEQPLQASEPESSPVVQEDVEAVPEVVPETVVPNGIPLVTVEDITSFSPSVPVATEGQGEDEETQSLLASNRRAPVPFGEEREEVEEVATEPEELLLTGNPELEARLMSIGNAAENVNSSKVGAQRKIELPDAQALIRRLVSATSVGDLLPLVHQAERVRPLLHDYYSRAGKRVDNLVSEKNAAYYVVEIDETPAVLAKIGTKEYSNSVVHIFFDGPDLKIDWESYVQYDPLPWKTLIDGEVFDPSDFRVLAREDDFYQGSYKDSEQYLCLHLSKVDEDSFLYGYVDLRTKAGLDLQARLKEAVGNQPSLALTLSLVRGSEAGRLQCDIVEMVSESWRSPKLQP